MSRVKDLLNPRDPAGHYVLPHVVVLALLVAISLFVGFGAGWFTAEHHWYGNRDAAYWQKHIPAKSLNVHPPAGSAPAMTTATRPKADSGGVKFADFPPVEDQGQTGSCQCFAFARQANYLVSIRVHHAVHFSCRFWYNVIGQGQDPGSYFDQYPTIWASQGGTLDAEFGYTSAPTGVEWPLPQYAYTDALNHRYTARTEVLSLYTHPGADAITAAEFALSKHLIVNIDMPVYECTDNSLGSWSYFDINEHGGIIDVPTCPVTVAGGHATSLLRYMRNLCEQINNEKVCGFFEGMNQWGKKGWGINCQTLQVDYNNGGCYLISYREVMRDGWGLEVLHLTRSTPPAAPKPPLSKLPADNEKRLLPAPPGTPLQVAVPKGHGRLLKVGQIMAKDASVDLGPLVNRSAWRHHISAPGLLAIIGSECTLFTHSPTCDNNWDGAGGSYGSCQVIVSTFNAYEHTNWYPSQVRDYENVASQCIELAAVVLADMARYQREVGCTAAATLPALAVAWNWGGYRPCWQLLNPTGQAYTNHTAYLGWWRWALLHTRRVR